MRSVAREVASRRRLPSAFCLAPLGRFIALMLAPASANACASRVAEPAGDTSAGVDSTVGTTATSDAGTQSPSSDSRSTTTSSTSITSASHESSTSGCPDINPGEGCPCGLEGDCEGGRTCNPVIDACVPDVCFASGNEGCECPFGICEEGLTCTQGFCTNTSCPTGTLGCHCIPNAWCKNDLVCTEGICT